MFAAAYVDDAGCHVAVTRLFPRPDSRDRWVREVLGDLAVSPPEEHETDRGWPYVSVAAADGTARYAFFTFMEWAGVAVASGPADAIAGRAAHWERLWRTAFPDPAGTAETLADIFELELPVGGT